MAQKRSTLFKDFPVHFYSGVEFSTPEKWEIGSSFGTDLFNGECEEFSDQVVQRILHRIKPSLKKIEIGDLVPYMKKKMMIGESEEMALKDAEDESEEQAARLVDFLIYKGPLGLAALYLSLGTKDIPNHYLLQKEFQYIVRSEVGTNKEEMEDKENVHDLALDIDGAVKLLDSVPLSKAAANRLLSNFSPPISWRSNWPTSVGGVMRVWLTSKGRKEMSMLVEALVYTEGLGQYTTTLASKEKNYTIPLDISRFFLSLLTEEWHKVAVYLGFSQQYLDSLRTHCSHGNSEDMVISFLRHWRLPECHHCFLPMLHQLKILAGVIVESKGKRPLSETRPDLEPVVYKNKKLKVDIRGTPHKRLECSQYLGLPVSGKTAHAQYVDSEEAIFEPEYKSLKSLSGDEVLDSHTQHSSSGLSEVAVSNWGITGRPMYSGEDERNRQHYQVAHDSLVNTHTQQMGGNVEASRVPQVSLSTIEASGPDDVMEEEQERVCGILTENRLGPQNAADATTTTNSFDVISLPVESLSHDNNFQPLQPSSHAEEARNVVRVELPETGDAGNGSLLAEGSHSISFSAVAHDDDDDGGDDDDDDDDNLNNFDSDSDEAQEGKETMVNPASSSSSHYDVQLVDIPGLSNYSDVLVSNPHHSGVLSQQSLMQSDSHMASSSVLKSDSNEEVRTQCVSPSLTSGEGQEVEFEDTNETKTIGVCQDGVRYEDQEDVVNILHNGSQIGKSSNRQYHERESEIGITDVCGGVGGEPSLEHGSAQDQSRFSVTNEHIPDSGAHARNQDSFIEYSRDDEDEDEEEDSDNNLNKFDTDSDEDSNDLSSSQQQAGNLPHLPEEAVVPNSLQTSQHGPLYPSPHPSHSQQAFNLPLDSSRIGNSSDSRIFNNSNSSSSSSSSSFPLVYSNSMQQLVESVASDVSGTSVELEQSVDSRGQSSDTHEHTHQENVSTTSPKMTTAEVSAAAHCNDTGNHLSLPPHNPSLIAANPTVAQSTLSLPTPIFNTKVSQNATGHNVSSSATNHPDTSGTANTCTEHSIHHANSGIGDCMHQVLATQSTTHHTDIQLSTQTQAPNIPQDRCEDRLNDFDSSSENGGDQESLLESGKLLNDFLEIPLAQKPSWSIAFPLDKTLEAVTKPNGSKKGEMSLPTELQLYTDSPLKMESKISRVEGLMQASGPGSSLYEDRNTEGPAVTLSHRQSDIATQAVYDEVKLQEQSLMEISENELPIAVETVTTSDNARSNDVTETESHVSENDNINQFDSEDDEERPNTCPTMPDDIALPNVEVDGKCEDAGDASGIQLNSSVSSLVHTDDVRSDGDETNYYSQVKMTENLNQCLVLMSTVEAKAGNRTSEDGLNDFDSDSESRRSIDGSVKETLGQSSNQWLHGHDALGQSLPPHQALEGEDRNSHKSKQLVNNEEEDQVQGSIQLSSSDDSDEDNLNNFDTDGSNEDICPEVNSNISDARNSITVTSNVQEGDSESRDDEPLYIQTSPIVLTVVGGKKKLDFTCVDIGEEDILILEKSLTRYPDLEVLDLADCGIGLEGAVSLARAFKHCTKLEAVILNGNMIGSNGLSSLCSGLRYCNDLVRLALADNNIGSVGIRALSNCLRYFLDIEILDLSDNAIDEDGTLALADKLKHCDKLLFLNLSRNRINNGGVVNLAYELQFCCKLQTLHLSCVNVDSEGVSALVNNLKNCAYISSLDLSCNKITCVGAEAIANGLPYWPKIEKLNLSSNEIRTPGANFLGSALKHCNNLQVISLSSNSIDSVGVQSLSYGLKHCTKLQSFLISSNYLGSEGIIALSGTLVTCTEIRVLELSHNDIDCEGVITLADALVTCTNIHELNLSYNRIGSNGTIALANALKMCPNLSILKLSNNYIDSKGAFALVSALKISEMLTILNLSNNNIGLDGLEALKEISKSCINIKIIELSGNSEPVSLQTLKQQCNEVLQEPSFSDKRTSERSDLDIDMEPDDDNLNNFDSQSDEEAYDTNSTSVKMTGKTSGRTDENLGRQLDAGSNNRTVPNFSSGSFSGQDTENPRARLETTTEDSSAPFLRNTGIINTDTVLSIADTHISSEGDSSAASNLMNLESSEQFRSLESNNSVSSHDGVDQVSKFSNSGRRPSASHSEGEEKSPLTSSIEIKDGSAVGENSNLSLNILGPELKDESADLAASDNASVMSKESSSNTICVEGSLSCASVPTVLYGNEKRISIQPSSRRVVSDTGPHDTGTESESGRRYLFKPVKPNALSSSLPLHLKQVSQKRAEKSSASQDVKVGMSSSVTPPHRMKKRSTYAVGTSSCSDSSDIEIGSGTTTIQGREKSSVLPSLSESKASDSVPSLTATRERISETSLKDDHDGEQKHSLPDQGKDTVSTRKESKSQGMHHISTEEEGVFKFSSIRRHEQRAPVDPGHFKEVKTHERSYTPVSDDIGDEGSDNCNEFDTDGSCSENESMKGKDIRIKSNSDLGFSIQGSPNGKSRVHQSQMNADRHNVDYVRQDSETGQTSASVKDESIDGTHFYQAVPPPFIHHALESAYGQGILVPRTSSELDRKSLNSDMTCNGSEKTKSAPKANSASRSGYLDNILAPEVYGEVNSENNLSAEDEDGRVIEHFGDSSSDLDATSEKESDNSSGSEFPSLVKIKNGSVRFRRTTDLSDSGSAHSKQSRRKPKKKNVKKNKERAGDKASGSNSDVVEKTPALANASVTASMIPSSGENASAVWEGNEIPDPSLQSNEIKPFVPKEGEEMCSEDLMAAIRDPEGLDLMRALLSSGAKANLVYKTGTYPIHQAVCSKNLDKVLMILEHKGDVNEMCKEKNKSALHYACEQKLVPIIQVLVLNGADLEAIDSSGMSVLHHKSTLESRDVVSFLLDFGIDINIKTECGATPLSMAVHFCDIATVRFLLDRGADPNVSWVIMEKDLTLTPLCLAAVKGNQAMVSLLVQFGAQINSHDESMYSPVSFAIMGKSVDLVRYFTEQHDFDCTLKGLVTPFCIGVQKKQYECIEILVSKYQGGLKAMLRDSKRAGYQRLTTSIYEYREYEVDPRPLPDKEEPTFSEQVAPQEIACTTQPATGIGHSAQVYSSPTRPLRPMPTFVPIQSNDGTAVLINVLTEFAIIAIQASIGYDEDGPEKLIRHAGECSLVHVETFFVNFFYNFEEYQQTRRLVGDFVGSGTPSPMSYLFLAGHVKREFFEALLAETKKTDLMDQMALVFQQFSDMEIPCDGNRLLDELFNMDQTGGNPLGGLTGSGFQFGSSGPSYGSIPSTGPNQGHGSIHSGGIGSGSIGGFQPVPSTMGGDSYSNRRPESRDERMVDSGHRLGGSQSRSKLVESPSFGATTSQHVAPGGIVASSVVVTTSSSTASHVGISGEGHDGNVSIQGEQLRKDLQVHSDLTKRRDLDVEAVSTSDIAARHVHVDSDSEGRNDLDDGSTGRVSSLVEVSNLLPNTLPEQTEYAPSEKDVLGDFAAGKSSGKLSHQYEEGTNSMAESLDTVFASDYPPLGPVHHGGSQLESCTPLILGFSVDSSSSLMYSSPVARSDVSASGFGTAISFSDHQRRGTPFYKLKEVGMFLRHHYEGIKRMNPNFTSECEENLKHYPIPDGRTSFSKEFQTSFWDGHKWIASSDSEWERKKERETAEGYNGLVESVTSRVLKQEENSKSVKKVVKGSASKTSQNSSPSQTPTLLRPSKSSTTTVRTKQVSPSVVLGRAGGKTPRNVSTSKSVPPRTASKSLPSKTITKSVPLRTQAGGKPTVVPKVSSRHDNTLVSVTSTRQRRLPETPSSRSRAIAAPDVGKSQRRPATEIHTATRGDTQKITPRAENHKSERVAHFFENIDGVQSSSPDESQELFLKLSLDPSVHNKWHMIGHYLFLEDAVINSIDGCCNFAEEKCLQMLREWKRTDTSADNVELIYALTNCGCYSSVERARLLMPKITSNSVTIQVSIPIDEKTQTELEKIMLSEKNRGASGAEVTLKGNKEMKLPLLTNMDINDVKQIYYTCMGFAGAEQVELISLTINFVR